MTFIKVPTTLVDLKEFQGARSTAMIKVKKDDGTVEKKKLEPVDTKKKVAGFILGTGSDSDSSDAMSQGSVSDGEEEYKQEMERLVDDELTNLLLQFDKLPRPEPKDITDRKVTFGQFKRSKTLVLDMDETLIHAKPSHQISEGWGDFNINLKDDDGEPLVFGVKNRPYLIEFLEKAS